MARQRVRTCAPRVDCCICSIQHSYCSETSRPGQLDTGGLPPGMLAVVPTAVAGSGAWRAAQHAAGTGLGRRSKSAMRVPCSTSLVHQ